MGHYSDYLAQGRAKSQQEIQADLLSLATDPRFASVIGWLDRNRETFVTAGSAQSMTKEHGKLAHCQGSVHALNVLLGQVANLMNPKTPRGGIPEPESEE